MIGVGPGGKTARDFKSLTDYQAISHHFQHLKYQVLVEVMLE
jgi:hypothetical protein